MRPLSVPCGKIIKPQRAEYKGDPVITAFMFDDYGAFLRVDDAKGNSWIADVAAKKA